MSLELEMCPVSQIDGEGEPHFCNKSNHHSGDHSFCGHPCPLLGDYCARCGVNSGSMSEAITSLAEACFTPDPINPSHYHGDSVMKFIEEFNLGFCLGNTVKYIARHEHKDKLQDLKKARWYLEREIAALETK